MKKKHIASVLLSAFLFTSVATPVFADTQVKLTSFLKGLRYFLTDQAAYKLVQCRIQRYASKSIT